MSTLLMMSNTHTTNESLMPNKPYALMRDFVPVAPVNYSDLVIVIHPSVPTGTPKAVVERLNTQINKLPARSDLQQMWAKQGAKPITMSPAEFDKYLCADIEKWANVVKISGAKVE
jgi:tripartite-type tricarboxylate transporter receptor subunit TctC